MTDNKGINIDPSAIARLSRLEFSEAELKIRGEEIRAFAEFAACLDGYADGDDQLALAPKACERALRTDAVHETESDKIVELSKGAYDGYIGVPRTVDA